MIEDIPFWVQEAVISGDLFLELTCGTGKVAIPVAGQAGVQIVGLDNSLSDAEAGPHQGPQAEPGAEILNSSAAICGASPSIGGSPWPSSRTGLSNLIFDLWGPEPKQITGDPSPPFLDREVGDPETGHRYLIWHRDQYDAFNQVVYGHVIVEELDERGIHGP